MEPELNEIIKSIKDRNKGIFILPILIAFNLILIYFVNSWSFMIGSFLFIISCTFLYVMQKKIYFTIKNIQLESPRNDIDVSTIHRIVEHEKYIQNNIFFYFVIYTCSLFFGYSFMESISEFVQFGVIQFTVFAIIYYGRKLNYGNKYDIILERILKK